jgi:E3 ubiquitin-protein ligase UBR7
MFQCLGLGSIRTGGCGEDWWHPECLVGLPRGLAKAKKEAVEGNNDMAPKEDGEDEIPLPPGFPAEDDFDTFICYKCLDSNPWLKRYASTSGFLPPVYKNGGLNGLVVPDVADSIDKEQADDSKKRMLDDNIEGERESKRLKEDDASTSVGVNATDTTSTTCKPKHTSIPSEGPRGSFSLFLKEDFREYLCHCPDCYPNLAPYPQLREEEEAYEPPLSESGDGANAGGSQGTGSLLERGEAALSNVDRVRAIEGVMVYNNLRDKVKEFLRPFAESGRPVTAEDIKTYFEKLRGDDQATREAGGRVSGSENGSGEGNDNRKEQSGMHLFLQL